jgi:hypothetical protein
MWLLWVRCLALGSSLHVLIKYILYRSCVDLNEHYIILIHTTRMTHLKIPLQVLQEWVSSNAMSHKSIRRIYNILCAYDHYCCHMGMIASIKECSKKQYVCLEERHLFSS